MSAEALSSNAYVDAVTADAPVAYYRLGETAAPFVDTMGGPSATVGGSGMTLNSTNLLSAQAGASVLTTGAGSWVAIPDSAPTRIGGSGTGSWCAEFCFRLATGGSGNQAVFFSASNSGTYMQQNGVGLPITGIALFNGGSISYPSPASPLLENTTYHFVIGYDQPASTSRFYVNGVQSGTYGSAAQGATAAAGWVIGEYGGGGYYVQGNYQEFALYNKLLSPARIAAHYAAASGAAAGGVATIADTRRTRARAGGKGR